MHKKPTSKKSSFPVGKETDTRARSKVNGKFDEFFTSDVDRYQKEVARKNSLALREKMKRKK